MRISDWSSDVCSSDLGMALALDSLRRFAALTRAMGVRRVDAVATAAVRDTANGAAFVAEIKRCCGLDVTVLSGNREARLSALGVLSGTPEATGQIGRAPVCTPVPNAHLVGRPLL